jgi:RimJ/RimL family protein N-acetyltransferase
MIELNHDEYVKVRPLFDGITHSRSFVFSLFEGNHSGRVYVDDAAFPQTALLALTCEYWCLAGRDDNPEFNQWLHDWVLANLKPGDNYIFFLPFTEPWRNRLTELFKTQNIITITRAAFDFNPERFQQLHAVWRERIPAGYRIVPYDRALAETAGGLAEFWGSIDHFLAHGLGYALMKGNEAVSRCHTVFVGDCEAEISISTDEKYRRQGLGTLATCAFIEACLQHGLKPQWSCWSNNAPSVAMAQHLSFTSRPDVRISFFHVNKPA